MASAITDALECPVCMSHFDEEEHVPTTFHCGHSLCIQHVSELQECPICRAKINGKEAKPSIALAKVSAAVLRTAAGAASSSTSSSASSSTAAPGVVWTLIVEGEGQSDMRTSCAAKLLHNDSLLKFARWPLGVDRVSTSKINNLLAVIHGLRMVMSLLPSYKSFEDIRPTALEIHTTLPMLTGAAAVPKELAMFTMMIDTLCEKVALPVSFVATTKEWMGTHITFDVATSRAAWGRMECITPLYYPNRTSVTNIKLGGMSICASNDVFCAMSSNVVLIDADFVSSMRRTFGADVFRRLVSPPAEITACAGKFAMHVLGYLPDPVVVEIGGKRAKIKDVLVVHNLPVPIHLSFKLLPVCAEDSVSKRGFVPEYFPDKYRSHPFWTDDSIHFLPYLSFV